jgi:serine/threonine-protein kinase
VSEDGSFYYAMELLEGLDLEKLVTRFGPQSPERVIHFLLQACDSLSEAHARGLIHRDIKPQNLFASRLGLNYDFVKVLDFGLVKTPALLNNSHIRLTLDGTTTGTPAFMAPEIALGNPVDARSDIYSLGCVAYRMLTGGQVFQRDTAMTVLLAHIQEDPVPAYWLPAACLSHGTPSGPSSGGTPTFRTSVFRRGKSSLLPDRVSPNPFRFLASLFLQILPPPIAPR